MNMKSIWGPVASIAALLAGIGCGGSSGGGSSPITPPPVMAQETYSAASLSGVYSGLFFFDQATGSIGTIQFDGKGNISGGSVTRGNGSFACQFTLQGTYTLQSTALGSGTLVATPVAATTSCAPTTTPVSLAAGQQGQSLLFLTNSGDQIPVFGWATKQ
jgi:hypothetical protein